MLGWAAGIWFTKQDVAAISLLGLILDVVGGLYLAHEVLGRRNGILRYLTHGISYGAPVGGAVLVSSIGTYAPSAAIIRMALTWVAFGVAACGSKYFVTAWPKGEQPHANKLVLIGVAVVSTIVAFSGVVFYFLPEPRRFPLYYAAFMLLATGLMWWGERRLFRAERENKQWVEDVPESMFGVAGVVLLMLGFIVQSFQYVAVIAGIPIR